MSKLILIILYYNITIDNKNRQGLKAMCTMSKLILMIVYYNIFLLAQKERVITLELTSAIQITF